MKCYKRQSRVAIVVKATGESSESSTSLSIVKSVQNVWDSSENRLALIGLGFAAVVAVWASANLITAIDKLPLIPSAFEFIGILFSSGSLCFSGSYIGISCSNLTGKSYCKPLRSLYQISWASNLQAGEKACVIESVFLNIRIVFWVHVCCCSNEKSMQQLHNGNIQLSVVYLVNNTELKLMLFA
ncbi:uncharacterized protein LOC114323916 isoform X2 [Camellia sinensis]|uniref:uncharacterized protein LOC114323916 isoform X2 n=1 Tax=Camellia sinensis TaxID=4442 RepID=UPI0010368F70|nr:uncharacterized protein LOC114323916 isoform X2 [Camellia sinensis]